MATHCSYCGTELPDEAEFCWNCGKPVVQGSNEEPPSPPRSSKSQGNATKENSRLETIVSWVVKQKFPVTPAIVKDELFPSETGSQPYYEVSELLDEAVKRGRLSRDWVLPDESGAYDETDVFAAPDYDWRDGWTQILGARETETAIKREKDIKAVAQWAKELGTPATPKMVNKEFYDSRNEDEAELVLLMALNRGLLTRVNVSYDLYRVFNQWRFNGRFQEYFADLDVESRLRRKLNEVKKPPAPKPKSKPKARPVPSPPTWSASGRASGTSGVSASAPASTPSAPLAPSWTRASATVRAKPVEKPETTTATTPRKTASHSKSPEVIAAAPTVTKKAALSPSKLKTTLVDHIVHNNCAITAEEAMKWYSPNESLSAVEKALDAAVSDKLLSSRKWNTYDEPHYAKPDFRWKTYFSEREFEAERVARYVRSQGKALTADEINAGFVHGTSYEIQSYLNYCNNRGLLSRSYDSRSKAYKYAVKVDTLNSLGSNGKSGSVTSNNSGSTTWTAKPKTTSPSSSESSSGASTSDSGDTESWGYAIAIAIVIVLVAVPLVSWLSSSGIVWIFFIVAFAFWLFFASP